MTNLAFDLKHVFRSLLKSPALFASAVLLLALGIGATTAIFSVVNRVLLDPLPYREPDRLVMIWGELAARDVMHFPESPTNLEDYRQQSQLFQDLAGVFSFGQPFVRDGAEPRQLTAGIATWNFLSVLGVEPMLGRGFDAKDGAFSASDVPPGTPPPGNAFAPPRTAIISHGLWQREFGGDPGAVGEIVELGGGPVEIVGVLPPNFRLHMPAPAGVASDIDIWVPSRVDLAAAPRNNVFMQMIGRLKDGVTVAQAQDEMDAISARLSEVEPSFAAGGSRKWVRPFDTELTADVRATLWALFGAAFFVLLIACANVANLLLVRAAGRIRELSVRSALGAGRGRLIRQMLLEAGVLALAGAAAGALLAFAGLKLLLLSAPDNIARLDTAGIDGGVLLFTIAVAALTTVLAGLVPAVHGSRLRIVDQLKERTGMAGSSGGNRLRTGLVVGEIALSFVLLIGTGLMIRSFMELQRVDPGFDAEPLLTFELNLPFTRYPDPESQSRFFEAFQERLSNLPGVVAASGITPLPLAGEPFHGRYSTAAAVDESSEFSQAHYRVVLPGYFETTQAELLAGRYLTRDDDKNARPYVVVDDTLAQKSWPGADPIGQRVWVRLTTPEMTSYEVVGVVRHQAQESLHEVPRETIYFANGTAGAVGGINDWVVRTELEPLSLVPQIKRELARLDARLPLAKIRPMGDYLADSMARTRFALQLIGAFGAAALVIAAIGLYAVIYYVVRSRRAEIGVRMSFGAEGRHIFHLFLRYGLALAAAGLSLGAVAAVGLSRSISGFLVGVTPTDLPTYLATALFFALIALAASFVPAWRAARVEPMRVLREE
ncbi:MAG TPA: ABC transporter permease [Woeseiaceae bacterium]|nr:ABC transporter permease [Woeseiaceae bacterium]